MHILVCIKQVPGTTNVQIDTERGTLKREGVEAIINPFDEYAIEEAVRLKEKFGGKVTVITMGPPQAESALREAISRGCDEAILVGDRAFAGADTWATAYALSTAIKTISDFSVIFCGKQATDGDTAQVGPSVAEMLNIPHVAYVRKIEAVNESSIKVQRMMEDGYDLIEAPVPCLLTVVKEINTPRIPSLKGKMAAKKAVIKQLNAQAISADTSKTGLNGSPTQVKKVFAPAQRAGGKIFEGEAQDVAAQLVKNLSDNGLI